MEKHLERQRKQEAEERALADAAAQKAEEDARAAESAAEARKQRQIEKKATQKERARLRALTADQGTPPLTSPPSDHLASVVRAVPWLCEDWSLLLVKAVKQCLSIALSKRIFMTYQKHGAIAQHPARCSTLSL